MVDVHQPTVCDVVVDDPRQRTTGVTQRQLETLVPKVRSSTITTVTISLIMHENSWLSDQVDDCMLELV